MRQLACFLATAASCVVAGAAHAGVEVTMTMEGGAGGGGEHMVLDLDADRLNQATGQLDIIYRADLAKAWIVDNRRHDYREMTPESMQQQHAQMEEAMQRMKQQMQSLPPEQRQRIEAMLAQRGMASDAPPPQPPTYTKSGPDKTVGKWTCTPYRMSYNGDDRQEICVAKLSDLGLTEDDLKAYVSFAAFMRQMMATSMGPGRAAMGFDFDGMTKAVGFPAFPVQWTHFDTDGKAEMTSTTTSIERKAIAADKYELPAGYIKQEQPRPPARPPQ